MFVGKWTSQVNANGAIDEQSFDSQQAALGHARSVLQQHGRDKVQTVKLIDPQGNESDISLDDLIDEAKANSASS